jgi:HKD family nuclease
MSTRAIRQAVSQDSLFSVLIKWCKEGAGEKTHKIRILTAFVSGVGVSAISPLLDIFLADGNSVDVIFGFDRNGTDRDAVRRLSALKKAHTGQFDVRVFQAPSHGSIFHPKLYIYERRDRIDFVIGSANLTSGGLGSNLESLLLYEDISRNSKIAQDVSEIWRIFAQPRPPLSAQFLQELTSKKALNLQRILRPRTPLETGSKSSKIRSLWKPLSRVPLPRSGPIEFRRQYNAIATQHYLLMDVLTETRKTQMQIPLTVIEKFFQIPKERSQKILVSLLTEDGLTQPISRPIVISGLKHGRLMRRLEMPQIRTMKRPLAVLFVKLRGKKRFAYVLIEQNTRKFGWVNRLLRSDGQQGGGVRRYLVGRRNDLLWARISKLLPR